MDKRKNGEGTIVDLWAKNGNKKGLKYQCRILCSEKDDKGKTHYVYANGRTIDEARRRCKEKAEIFNAKQIGKLTKYNHEVSVKDKDLSMKQNGLGVKVSGEDTIMDVSTSDSRNQSNATRRQEERRRREAKVRKRKADEKAAVDAMHRRQMENKKYFNKLQEKRFMERKEYHEELSEEQMERLLEDQEAV